MKRLPQLALSLCCASCTLTAVSPWCRANGSDNSNANNKAPFDLRAEQHVLTRDNLRLPAPVGSGRVQSAAMKPTRLSLNSMNFSLNAATGRAPAKMVAEPKTYFWSGLTKEDAFNSQSTLKSAARILANHNIELIIDRSTSMGIVDCPGGMSRWKWCGLQAANLAESLAPFTSSGLTIVTFATEYDVIEHARAQDIGTAFNGIKLQGCTRLYEPLSERIDDYLARCTPGVTKPLLLVVITDGMPFPNFEPPLVKAELIDATNRIISPEQIKVIFCQIGNDDAPANSSWRRSTMI